MDSPQWTTLVELYSNELEKNGLVNKKKFYDSKVRPLMPTISYMSFLARIRRLNKKSEPHLMEKISDAQEHTIRTLNAMLAIGEDTIRKILMDPDSVSPREKLDMFFKAMRAQDSRMATLSRVKREDLESRLFMEKFANQAYAVESPEQLAAPEVREE